MLLAMVAAAMFAYVGYRLYLRTNALTAPALVTPAMDVHRLLSPSLAVRWDRLVHGNARPLGARPKLIALTFDDGPYPVDTPLLLDALDDVGVPATFFLIGRDGQQYPELVRRIAARGHEIANHTLTHPDLDRLDDAAVAREIAAGAGALSMFVADPALKTMLRPPHGRYTEATLRVAQAAGYNVVLWNDDPGDWRSVPAPDLLDHIAAHATAPEILLLHSGRHATMDVLPALVARFRGAGYRFVTVGSLLHAVSAEQLNHPEKQPLTILKG
ncbi:MAG: polysaccharide deacetylase family protein [Candidatus Velthaea sp.]